MAVAIAPREVPSIRRCPYCRDGIGTVQRTESVTKPQTGPSIRGKGERKIRHYKCDSCLRYWQQPIVIDYPPPRTIREE